MSATHLKRYRHFPTLPDSYALLMLLRLNAVEFETRYQRGANYDRARHEPDRLEVWIRAADYDQVRQLEATLTREQALVLAARYQLLTLTLPDAELRNIAAQAARQPVDAAAAAGILRDRLPDQPPVPLAAAPAPAGSPIRQFFTLLILAGLAALIYYWLK